MEFCVISQEEYQVFVSQHPYRNFMNSIEAMKVKLSNHWQVEYVGVKENNQLLCATALTSILVMKVFRFYYAQRGFLIDYSDLNLLAYFTKALKQYLKSKHALYLILDPNVLYKERDIDGNLVENGFDNSYVVDNLKTLGYQHQGFTNDYSVISEVRWMFSLYLDNQDEASLLKAMHQQTRWSVNKTLKTGIKVKELSVEEVGIFYEMMQHTANRRNFKARKLSFYEDYLRIFGPKAKLLLAYLDIEDYKSRLTDELNSLTDEHATITTKLLDTPNNKKLLNKLKVNEEALTLTQDKLKEADELESNYGQEIPMASSLFTIEDNEVVYLFSAAYDKFKKFNAPYAIQWYMIRHCLEQHINRYNFYGISGNFDEKAEDYGVYEFKKGFNGVVEELVGDFILPINGFMYKLYKMLKG